MKSNRQIMSQYFEMKDRFDRSYEESQSFNYHNQFSQESYADQNKRKELMKIYQKYGNIGCILNNQTETTTYTKSKADSKQTQSTTKRKIYENSRPIKNNYPKLLKKKIRNSENEDCLLLQYSQINEEDERQKYIREKCRVRDYQPKEDKYNENRNEDDAVIYSKYHQRKESISNNSDDQHEDLHSSRSKIPIPSAVKSLIKNSSQKKASKQSLRPKKKNISSNNTRDIERDDSRYNFSCDQLRLRDNNSQCVEELQPCIIENTENSSFEAENDNKNLVVNLEDLVNEEYFINRISEHIHKKKTISELCKRWWKITDRSSVKEMAAFFEEPLSKKLIKNHQMLLCVFVGFLQISDMEIYNHLKTWTNSKNIINYLHRNFLVFVQFICNNLTEEQFDAAYDWAIQLENVLKTRSVMKSHYNVYNSDLLQNNNSISFQLLKDLLRQKSDESNFKEEAYYILKNIDGMEIQIVRDFMYSTANKSSSRESTENREKTKKAKAIK